MNIQVRAKKPNLVSPLRGDYVRSDNKPSFLSKRRRCPKSKMDKFLRITIVYLESIRKSHNGFSYKVIPSESSSSIYVCLYYSMGMCNQSDWIRISDHWSDSFRGKQILVYKNTKFTLIRRSIDNTLLELGLNIKEENKCRK